jgi:signal transduction histidine kinase
VSLSCAFRLFTNKVRGIGFCLPICKRIAEAHGGKIVVKSKIGKETMVTIPILVEPEPTVKVTKRGF